MATLVIILIFGAILIITLWRVNYKPYYQGNDCPFMGVSLSYSHLFLKWVWDNRKRIEVAGLPYYCRRNNNWVFFITTPFVLGGWMFITCADNGIELKVAKDLDDFGRSYTKVSYCPNWNFVPTSSKRLWLKVYKYFEEQKEIATKTFSQEWVNPKLNNNGKIRHIRVS